jgi:shikimate dehydrogenase
MKIFCIIGDERVFNSKSPDMFNSVLKQTGIRGQYVPLHVDSGNISQALQNLSTFNFSGANITVPYKESVVPCMDVLSEGANIIGSVNTIVRTNGTLKGYNTNAIGFMNALKGVGFDPSGKSALIFGTGGVARAVGFVLNWLRAESIVVVGRSLEKADRIFERVTGTSATCEMLLENPVSANIVINTTSVSTPDEAPDLADMANRFKISNCELVMDLNYGRSDNFWQEMAQKKGIHFIDGLSTLANQAAHTFALWTGVRVEPEAFLDGLSL